MKIIYGENKTRFLPEVCSAAGWERILLVCGKNSFESSGAAAALPDLQKVVAVTRWSDFSPNTDVADVERGLNIMKGERPDAVLGIGGGSAMDMAKLLCAYEDEAGVSAAVRLGAKIDKRRAGLVLVPTTSGSGSEATHFAVAYIGQEKFSPAGSAFYADTVILDPLLSKSGSARQRATSGIDAVCQAIESLWAVSATEQSRRHARHALFLLTRHIESFVRNADAVSARGMALGSHLAGRAIDVSKTTAAHALSYAITKRHGVSHGHAVALTLSGFIATHGRVEGPHTPAMRHILKALLAKDAEEAARNFRKLLASIGLESSIAALGVKTKEEREIIVASINVERLKNNPVPFTQQEMLSLLERAS